MSGRGGSPIIGEVEVLSSNKIPEVTEADYAPHVLNMELPSLEGPRKTQVFRGGVFTLSVLRSQDERFPDFVAMVIGDGEGAAFYIPLPAERCDEVAAMMTRAAKDLRGDSDN